MPSCIDCGIELTDENWFASSKRQYCYVCSDCRNKRHQDYRKNASPEARQVELAKKREWYKKNQERVKTYWQRNKERDKVNRMKRLAMSGAREKYNAHIRAYNRTVKIEVLSHYSGTNPPQCANPFGEHEKSYITIDSLSIDHIDGGGTRHLKTLRQGFYFWLRKHNYPKGYQVLCMNCQFIKRMKNREVLS